MKACETPRRNCTAFILSNKKNLSCGRSEEEQAYKEQVQQHKENNSRFRSNFASKIEFLVENLRGLYLVAQESL
ncbi:hypothetical protein PoB_000041600 [Plakobranchus ocellatus]|uniref:Uncharacterized protein n=1 Tax=Plakobranchus ocellatus TaxID=259542 RepID=A0AAV3WTP4_9GAST|nr:hypothetical protein PoB_000041600 [Plakobranchus ocellatus]